MLNLIYIIGAVPWILIIGGWNSTYIQRIFGTFLLARADSIDSKRIRMSTSLAKWQEKAGLIDLPGKEVMYGSSKEC